MLSKNQLQPRMPLLPQLLKKSQRRSEETIQMMMIPMLNQSWSHAAAANASAQMNLLRTLHAADASQSNVVLLLLESSPY